MYLIDTDVLSALRKRDRNPAIAHWIETQDPSDLYLSVVTVGEIERGIAKQQRLNPHFSQELSLWLGRVLAWYSERILPIEAATARRWGRMSANLGYESADLFIAATALENGLIVVTRNVRHFKPTGVPTLDPLSPTSS